MIGLIAFVMIFAIDRALRMGGLAAWTTSGA